MLNGQSFVQTRKPTHSFLLFAGGFLAATIFGTISHECGHFMMAKLLGYHAHMSYASTHTLGTSSHRDGLMILAAGPMQTVMTGTAGLLMLSFGRKKYPNEYLSAHRWIAVFLSLFWLRQVFNFGLIITGYLSDRPMCTKSDEVKLARYFGLPILSISAGTAIIGACVVAYLFLKIVPKRLRASFAAGGFAGCLSGYFLWMRLVGPLLMP